MAFRTDGPRVGRSLFDSPPSPPPKQASGTLVGCGRRGPRQAEADLKEG